MLQEQDDYASLLGTAVDEIGHLANVKAGACSFTRQVCAPTAQMRMEEACLWGMEGAGVPTEPVCALITLSRLDIVRRRKWRSGVKLQTVLAEILVFKGKQRPEQLACPRPFC